jgi:hypothetical protein
LPGLAILYDARSEQRIPQMSDFLCAIQKIAAFAAGAYP